MEKYQELTIKIREERKALRKKLNDKIKEATKIFRKEYKEEFDQIIKPLIKEREREKAKFYYNKYYKVNPINTITKRDRVANELFGRNYKELNDVVKENKVKAQIVREDRVERKAMKGV